MFVCLFFFRFVQGERDSYYRRISAAQRHPHSYLSVIIDGSDNSQYHLPYFVHRDADSNSGWKIGLHLFGAIVHGVGPQLFPIYDTCPQGTNATIEVLHQVLVAECARRGGKLPQVLYLQLDNTVRQCKSRYLMGWLGLLVHWRVFQDVYVSFLPKGHTHEDIDQLFSQLAMWFRKHDAPSILGFEAALRSAITCEDRAPTNIRTLDRVANIRDWIAPLLVNLKGITLDKHQFRLTRINGDHGCSVRIMTRNWIARQGHNAWGGFQTYQYHSALFNRDKETLDFLEKGPSVLLDGTIPPMERKLHDVKKKSGKKRKHVPGKKLRGDVEKIARQRRVSERHYDSLQNSLAIVNSKDELDFQWSEEEIATYIDVSRSRPVEPAGTAVNVDYELQEAIDHHASGSVWAVRADFTTGNKNWKKKSPTSNQGVEFFWLVRVDAEPHRDQSTSSITVACTYFESTRILHESDDRKWRAYKIGDSHNLLPVSDLQVPVELNNKDKKEKDQGIKLTMCKDRLKRFEDRVWADANGWRVADMGGGSDSDEDCDPHNLN